MDIKSSKLKKPKKSKKKHNLTSKRARKLEECKAVGFEGDVYHLSSGDEDCSKGMKSKLKKAKKSKKKHNPTPKKVREIGELNDEAVGSEEDGYHLSSGDDDCSKGMKSKLKKAKKSKKKQNLTSNKVRELEECNVEAVGSKEDVYHLSSSDDDCSKGMKSKLKKAKKRKRKQNLTSKKAREIEECNNEAVGSEEDVYHLSSGDNDCSKGMKKWLTEYHQNRPGLEILHQRIDNFVTTHEAQLEKARKEREALAAEGGWTVVVHHKGKKRSTDAESGISVGSVAQAAVLENMAKKKKKAVAQDFYNFQKREAQLNEVMMLQSKFEQDKKRIQQMRAARKFRPY